MDSGGGSGGGRPSTSRASSTDIAGGFDGRYGERPPSGQEGLVQDSPSMGDLQNGQGI